MIKDRKSVRLKQQMRLVKTVVGEIGWSVVKLQNRLPLMSALEMVLNNGGGLSSNTPKIFKS